MKTTKERIKFMTDYKKEVEELRAHLKYQQLMEWVRKEGWDSEKTKHENT